jgi:myo-inositol-1(or 4)-monophosphatase
LTVLPLVPQNLEALEAFARSLADASRMETLRVWASGSSVEDKGGAGAFDPVTEGDRAAERAMRDLIERHHPDHGIMGEEYPDRPPQGRYSWSLDPIDGTRSFICGLPTWVTLIALLDEGEPVLGLIDVPRLDELYVGLGGAARLSSNTGRSQLAVSGCTNLGDARLSTTDPYLFTGSDSKGFERLRTSARTTRYGHDGYAYARLAAGSLDLIVEAGLKPHDYNALIPVVRGAGGVIGDWSGGGDFSEGKVVAAASEALFDEAVRLLNP